MLTFINTSTSENRIVLVCFLGRAPTQVQIESVVIHASICEATGLELEECFKILGRPIRKTDRHIFVAPDTTELIRNWG